MNYAEAGHFFFGETPEIGGEDSRKRVPLDRELAAHFEKEVQRLDTEMRSLGKKGPAKQ